MIWRAPTESKKVDAQSGAEIAMEILISLQSGGNLIHDCGFMDVGITGSLDQLVLCDEVIGMAKRYCQSVAVDDDRIGFDTIKAVGPGGELFERRTYLPIFPQRYLDAYYHGTPRL